MPLVFLTSKEWSGDAPSDWCPWIKRFNKTGYSCLSIDVSSPARSLAGFEEELKQQIRHSPSPFPPVLFARKSSTLIAQTYVSSHPLSGLVLVEPPLSVANAADGQQGLLDEQQDEFDYEPFFPIAIVAKRKDAQALEQHRLRQEYLEDVDLLVTPDAEVMSHDAYEYVDNPLNFA